jgi:peptidyl-prolyl cis-trans isomerase D
MLDIMRRKKALKGILWAVIFALALGMLLFFVPGVNMGNVATDSSAASVDGKTIPMKDFLDAYRRLVKRYSDGGKNKTDPETLKALGVPKRVLDELISEKVLEVVASRFGIEVTPAEIRQAIETSSYLQDQGKFIGIERYKALLAANDLSVEEFEEEMRTAQLRKKVRAIITDSMEIPDRELREEFSNANQKTQVEFAILKKEDFKKRVKPTDAELHAYFDGHKTEYQIKEKRKAQYLLIPYSIMLPGVKVTDQEIMDEWEKSPHSETVEAAHILLKVDDPSKDAEVKAKAEGILKQLKNGGNFAELAKKFSQDPGSAAQGGILPPFSRGQMVKEFENAAFSLKPGETSGLVRSQYGYHIIRTMRHETPTLESDRSNILIRLRVKKAQELAKAKAEEAAKIVEKSKDLSSATKALGQSLEVKETGLFQKDDNPFEFGISQAIRDEVFHLKEINTLGKVEEHPLGYAIPKLIEVQPPKPGDFAQFRNKIEQDYTESKSKELMEAEAKKLSQTARAEGSLEKAAKAMGLTVKTSQPFNASGSPDAEIGGNAEFNKAAFALQPGGISEPLTLFDKMAVLQVKSRTPFDEAAFQKEKESLRNRMLQSNQDAYFEDYIRNVTDELEKAGKIRYNPKTIENIPSGAYY